MEANPPAPAVEAEGAPRRSSSSHPQAPNTDDTDDTDDTNAAITTTTTTTTTDANAPASPPLPRPHTAVTPGPRAARLQELYAQRLRHTLGKLNWDNFAGCYPTVAARADGVLRQVQEQMVEKLGEKCEKEFENIMVSRQVIPKLNDLESLISDAARRRTEAPASQALPTPPHLHPPPTILAAHLTPALTAHQSQLNARLQNTQAQNARLFDQVQRQRDEMAALLERLEAVVADVAAANEALGGSVADVVEESREGLAVER